MNPTSSPHLIAVDWGTSNARAYLLDAAGALIEERHSDKGVQFVESGQFAVVLDALCGVWQHKYPALPVLMAGMIGSRNGWIEAAYVRCPGGAAEVAGNLLQVPSEANIAIVPGLDCRWSDGAYDVMRGEETQVLGTGIDQGILCLPGTHSKWIAVRDGRIERFATFITGEFFAGMTASFIGRLAEPPEDPAGAVEGARAAALPGGLLRALFQARSRVLGGDMTGHAVKPFLSALIVQSEIREALDMFGSPKAVTLLASDPHADVYRQALESEGTMVTLVDSRTAFLAGIRRIQDARAGVGR